MTTVRRESLADQVAELLLARVRAGEWQLGSKLPGETTLAPQLGVGRSTVREAIRQLAGRGVLTTRQGAGVFLAALDIAPDRQALLSRADIAEVLEVRSALEVEAAALAAERRTEAQLADLRRALDERRTHREDVEEHVDTDAAFHRGVVLAAHSPLLLGLFDEFAPRSRTAMVDMLTARGHHGDDADHDVHGLVLDAITSRDGARAAALTRTHLTALKKALT